MTFYLEFSGTKTGYVRAFSGMNTNESINYPRCPFSPDIPIRKPISPYPDIEDDREPIDEPYLPDDPGDEPDKQGDTS